MGNLCATDHVNYQSTYTRQINLTINHILNDEFKANNGGLAWYKQFNAVQKIEKKYLFQNQYQSQINIFRRGQDLGPSPNKEFIIIPLKKQIQDSCVVPEDEIGYSIQQQPKKEFTKEDLSFFMRKEKNQSIYLQMDIIFKSEYLEERSFNSSAKKFLKWIHLFKKHYQNNFLKNLYQNLEKFILNKIQNSTKHNLRLILDSILETINKFIKLMIKIYVEVYQIKKIQLEKDGTLFKNQNFYNLIMSILFKSTTIYQNIFMLFKQRLAKDISVFQQRLTLMQHNPISIYQIPKKFQLKEEQPSKQLTQFQLSMSQHISTSQFSQILNKTIKNQQLIFPECIQKLKDIKNAKTPISKLKILIFISKQILTQIQQFYHKRRETIPILDPDSLQSIIMYIIVKAQYRDLIIDLEIIQNFSTKNCLNCISGYYLTVYKACIQMIIMKNKSKGF